MHFNKPLTEALLQIDFILAKFLWWGNTRQNVGGYFKQGKTELFILPYCRSTFWSSIDKFLNISTSLANLIDCSNPEAILWVTEGQRSIIFCKPKRRSLFKVRVSRNVRYGVKQECKVLLHDLFTASSATAVEEQCTTDWLLDWFYSAGPQRKLSKRK